MSCRAWSAGVTRHPDEFPLVGNATDPFQNLTAVASITRRLVESMDDGAAPIRLFPHVSKRHARRERGQDIAGAADKQRDLESPRDRDKDRRHRADHRHDAV